MRSVDGFFVAFREGGLKRPAPVGSNSASLSATPDRPFIASDGVATPANRSERFFIADSRSVDSPSTAGASGLRAFVVVLPSITPPSGEFTHGLDVEPAAGEAPPRRGLPLLRPLFILPLNHTTTQSEPRKKNMSTGRSSKFLLPTRPNQYLGIAISLNRRFPHYAL